MEMPKGGALIQITNAWVRNFEVLEIVLGSGKFKLQANCRQIPCCLTRDLTVRLVKPVGKLGFFFQRNTC
jgi:hypothetical protein